MVFSDSDCEFVQGQTPFPENVTLVWRWSVRQICILRDRPSKLCQNQWGDPRRKVRFSKQCQNCMRSRADSDVASTDGSARGERDGSGRREPSMGCPHAETPGEKWTGPGGNQRVGTFLLKMQMSASDRSQKTRGTKEVTAVSCCSTRLEVKEGVEALRWLMQRVLPLQQIMDCTGKSGATSAGGERHEVSREHAWSGICNQKDGCTARTVVYAARPFTWDTQGGDSNGNWRCTITPGVWCCVCLDARTSSLRWRSWTRKNQVR